MLIVEGTDLLGKTTFAKKLVQQPALIDAGYIYKHFSRLPVGFNFYWGYLEHAAPRSVQDRFHMSEIAYSYARGDIQSGITPEVYRLIDGYLRNLGAFTVVITADDCLLEERYDQLNRDEMYDLEKIQTANKVFQEIVANERFTYNQDVYCLDIDANVHLTKEQPWLGEKDVKRVLTAYLRRQTHVRNAHLSRPAVLPPPFAVL